MRRRPTVARKGHWNFDREMTPASDRRVNRITPGSDAGQEHADYLSEQSGDFAFLWTVLGKGAPRTADRQTTCVPFRVNRRSDEY